MTLFQKAKQHSLPDLATRSGWKLRKQGSGFSAKHCPHCEPGANDTLSIYPKDGIWRWNCFRCKRGGTVVDFACAVWKMNETEAAKLLADGSEADGGIPIATVPEVKPVSSAALAAAVEAMLKRGHTSVAECMAYLKSRHISERIIMQAVQRGMLRFLQADPYQCNRMLNEIVGIGPLRESGLLKEGSKWPAIAFRPMVFFFPGGGAAEFRLSRDPKEDEPKAIRYGHVKWPWWWKEGEKVHTVYVVEGAIDLLSRAEMGLKQGEALLGIPGTSSWRPEWFAAALNAHPGATFSLGLDNDKAGREALTGRAATDHREAIPGIFATLQSLGAKFLDEPPSLGLDWNEHLESMRTGIRIAA